MLFLAGLMGLSVLLTMRFYRRYRQRRTRGFPLVDEEKEDGR